MDRRDFISSTILATAGAATAFGADLSLAPSAPPQSATGKEPQPVRSGEFRVIALEEHFVSPRFAEGPGRSASAQANNPADPAFRLAQQLLDVGEKRIAQMDAARVDMQFLSLNSPGVEQLEAAEATAIARESNDYLYEAMKRHSKRLGGFAALPTADPKEAVKELERRVRDQGFMGAIINGHSQGRYLDDKFFWPILECAEALKVPIYLHPTAPPEAVLKAYYRGFAPGVTGMLSISGWGWHIETAVHVIRLILGGAFDRYPNLQIVIGHMGEALPFMAPRLEDKLKMPTTKLQRTVNSYLRENVHYTFGGFNYTTTFLNLLLQVGIDRIMFSTDYPFGSLAEGRNFLDQLPISPDDKAKIAHRNAERLFRL